MLFQPWRKFSREMRNVNEKSEIKVTEKGVTAGTLITSSVFTKRGKYFN